MQYGDLRRCLVVGIAVVLLFYCGGPRVRDAPTTSKLSKLVGRCIELKQQLFLVPGKDEDFVDGYLAETNNQANTGTMLQAGDQFVVQRVVLKRAFDGRYAIVVATCKTQNLGRRVAIFLLLNPEWVNAATNDAFENREDASQVGPEVLSAERAEWCR